MAALKKIEKIFYVSIFIKATLLSEVGSNFTADDLREDIGCQFKLKDFKGGPIIKIVGLDRCS